MLSAILLEAAALMQSADGCLLYVVGCTQENPDDILVTEIWDSKEDHDNSLSYPGVKELIAKAIPILASNPEKGKIWDILGGVGID